MSLKKTTFFPIYFLNAQKSYLKSHKIYANVPDCKSLIQGFVTRVTRDVSIPLHGTHSSGCEHPDTQEHPDAQERLDALNSIRHSAFSP
ncbi:MAG TPA: hypothetical protein DCR35_16600, partial [Runella sp.]|nr:hypothetical protein [Runella sp.]